MPHYPSPPWLVVSYSFVGLLLVLTALLWSIRTPVYATGPGVVITMPAGCFRSGQAFLVAFLPSEFSPLLKAGQPAMVYLSELEASEPANGMNRRVAAVSPALSSPAAVRARYTLDASTGLLVKGPTVVTLIRLDEDADTIVGSVGEVQIQVGTQRGLAFLPGVGRLFSVESHASE